MTDTRTCWACGETKAVTEFALARARSNGYRRKCKACENARRARSEAEARDGDIVEACRRAEPKFWTRVERGPACWLWRGRTFDYGYGVFYVRARHMGAHRVSWIISNQRDPGDGYVLHHCDNPLCVNPAHLYLGTHADNMADVVRRGRRRCHSQAKLTEAQVLAMRALHSATGESCARLAERFGVSYNQAWCIVTGRAWKRLQSTEAP